VPVRTSSGAAHEILRSGVLGRGRFPRRDPGRRC
jgi:hypothetical protein